MATCRARLATTGGDLGDGSLMTRFARGAFVVIHIHPANIARSSPGDALPTTPRPPDAITIATPPGLTPAWIFGIKSRWNNTQPVRSRTHVHHEVAQVGYVRVHQRGALADQVDGSGRSIHCRHTPATSSQIRSVSSRSQAKSAHRPAPAHSPPIPPAKASPTATRAIAQLTPRWHAAVLNTLFRMEIAASICFSVLMYGGEAQRRVVRAVHRQSRSARSRRSLAGDVSSTPTISPCPRTSLMNL